MKLRSPIEYKSTKETAQKWGVSVKLVTKYCREEKIPRAFKDPKTRKWLIPVNAIKPLNKKEVKEAIYYLLRIQNSMRMDEKATKDAISKIDFTGVYTYLIQYGYITFKTQSRNIDTLLFTDKGFSVLTSGISIQIEFRSIIQIVAAFATIINAIGG